MSATLADQIDRLLPQTQCGQCGYPACRPYAEALADQQADINQCPPGGDRGVARLATLLGREIKPINPANGVAKTVPTVARIEEAPCIGCTKCIQACPVDAILGAANQMHTVIEALCTGCELCLPPCPVDCIVMAPVAVRDEVQQQRDADAARTRYHARLRRLERDALAEAERRAAHKAALREQAAATTAESLDPVARALAAARARRADTTPVDEPADDPVARALARVQARRRSGEPRE